MPKWDAEQYLRFAEERTRPCQDLLARIPLGAPARVIDLGCGPGNSTAALAARWPEAEVVGLDSSPEMIARARVDFPAGNWILGDLMDWHSDEPFDVVFSNAALQWLPGHRELFPQLLGQVGDGGVLAVQMPGDPVAPPHRLMRELAASEAWRAHFPAEVRAWCVEPPEFYYDVLSPQARRIDLWATDYFHILDGVPAIADWYRGTGLRPYLEALPGEELSERFVADFVRGLEPRYRPRRDGRVVFPFRRLFLIASR